MAGDRAKRPDGRDGGGRDGGARRRERLHRFLGELVARVGRMEATKLLGVNYRTLVSGQESGQLTGRMSDALERLLLTWDGGPGAGPDDGGEDVDPEPDGALSQRVAALEAGLDELTRELRSGLDAVRVAVGDAAKADRASGGGKSGSAQPSAKPCGSVAPAPPQSPATASPAAPPVAGLGSVPTRPYRPRRVYPDLVTLEPDDDDPEVFGDAWALVEEWRELRARHPFKGRSLSWLIDHERLLTLELAMLEEHGLTLPPEKQPARGLSRRDHTRWRWSALYNTQVAIRKRKLLRWLRRILTLGLWRQ